MLQAMLDILRGKLFRISGATYLIWSVDSYMKLLPPINCSVFYIVDLDMTILILPLSSLMRTLSGVNVYIINPESSKSLITVAKLATIAFNFWESITSINYWDLILSKRSAIKVDNNLFPAWGFSDTIFWISPVLGFYMTANTFRVCLLLLKLYIEKIRK